MTRAYLDTNYLYLHAVVPSGLDYPSFERWRGQVVAELGSDPGVVSSLVVDELAYRLVIAWLRDDGDPDPLSRIRRDGASVMRSMRERLGGLWRMLDELGLEVVHTTDAAVERARVLMTEPGLLPRDAFHAALAIEAGCSTIVSVDADFDDVPDLQRLGPIG